MRAIGIALVILGIIGLAYGRITYKQEKQVLDVGPIKATATENRTIQVPPILGIVAIVAGVVMLVVPRHRL